MKKILISLIIGLLAGICITAFLFAKFLPRPGPGVPTKVIENSTKAEEKKTDIIIREKKEGDITSRVPVKPSLQPIPIPDDSPAPKPVLTLQVGDKYSTPAAGEIKTVYLDISGRQIGEGVHQVTGETSVIVGSKYLDIKTNFQDLTTVAIGVPDPPKKVWHIGLNIVSNFDRFSLGGYAQRDFYFWQSNWIDVLAFGRAETERETEREKDWEWRAKAGIEFSF
jgi:hypothetical protein